MDKKTISASNINMPIIIYDGKCPICSREIAHYKRRSGAKNLKWIDATRDIDFLKSIGVEQKTVLEKFHVMNVHGEWEIGAAGFVYMWSYLWPYRWLSNCIKFLHLIPVLEKAYLKFLKIRNRKKCNN
tara:strand:- start:45 stop:428 length:384 start_codon:yes stop_codon:yes gene_type:complete